MPAQRLKSLVSTPKSANLKRFQPALFLILVLEVFLLFLHLNQALLIVEVWEGGVMSGPELNFLHHIGELGFYLFGLELVLGFFQLRLKPLNRIFPYSLIALNSIRIVFGFLLFIPFPLLISKVYLVIDILILSFIIHYLSVIQSKSRG